MAEPKPRTPSQSTRPPCKASSTAKTSGAVPVSLARASLSASTGASASKRSSSMKRPRHAAVQLPSHPVAGAPKVTVPTQPQAAAEAPATLSTFSLLKCQACEHGWYPRAPKVPRICPKCKSPFWQEGRRRPPRAEQLRNAALRRSAEEAVLQSEGNVSEATFEDRDS